MVPFNIHTHTPTAHLPQQLSLCAVARKSFEELESCLPSDLDTVAKYFLKWRLKPNALKFSAILFPFRHLVSSLPAAGPRNNQPTAFELYPTYLGITLDHSLSFPQHMEKTHQNPVESPTPPQACWQLLGCWRGNPMDICQCPNHCTSRTLGSSRALPWSLRQAGPDD